MLGNAFISALRSRVNRTVGVYAVQYPADTEVAQGANDMSRHIQDMVNSCPDTRLVLGATRSARRSPTWCSRHPSAHSDSTARCRPA